MPLIMYHFGQLNPWAIFAGILPAPLVFASLIGGLLEGPLTLLWPGLAETWATLAWPVEGMRRAVDALTHLPWGDVPTALAGDDVLFYLLLLTALLPCPRPGLRWWPRARASAAAADLPPVPRRRGAAGSLARRSA